jgi:hypothetical protein
MQYSAGMVSRPFWYLESKKTAKYLIECKDIKEIKDVVVTENIYQTPSEHRATQVFNTVVRRLSSLDDFLISAIVNTNIATSKLVVLLSIMKTDRLFFEFMYEIFRDKLILGDFNLKDRDISNFFDTKKSQSEVISKWTDTTITKLKRCYARMLFEAGLINNSSGDRTITPVIMDYKVSAYLKEHNMSALLYAITGEF